MSVEQQDTVDSIEVDGPTGKVVLLIEDDLGWEDPAAHLAALQGKLGLYAALVQSGELVQLYPDARGRAVVISVVARQPPPPEAEAFMQRMRAALEAAELGTPVELRARLLVRR